MVRNAADRHQHKRAFQPQITSFFTPSDNSILPASSTTHASLAPSVQSSLLSVGMRIRKAVPEGYKTHKTMPLSSISATRLNAAPTSSLPAVVGSGQSKSTAQSPARTRELQPFCGIHRVGGMAVQQTMLDAVNGYDSFSNTHGSDCMDNFASSQESNFSIAGDEGVTDTSFFSNSNKRQLDDNEDEDDEEDNDFAHFMLQPESSHDGSARRTFAKPRSRRREPSFATFSTYVDPDFDDAPFLKPLDHHMGGM